LLVAWSPSPALSGTTASHDNDDESRISIKNKTKERITLTLKEITLTPLQTAETYEFRVPAGKSSHRVKAASYTYSFDACGIVETGSINLKDDEELKILDCPELDTASVRVNNRTKDRLSLNLKGAESYVLNAKADGKTNFINLVPGVYSYSVDACGATLVGTVNLRDTDKDVVIKIQQCPDEKTSKLTVRNKTTQKVTVDLSGTDDFEFSVNSDRKRNFEVTRGVYGYAYEACGELASGVMNLIGDDTLKIVECEPEKYQGELSVNNRTIDLVTVVLSGPGGRYAFDAPTGFNSGFDVVKGIYTYSFEACGGAHTGKIKIGNHETLKIRPC
jgi:hypothetical protein